MTLLTHINPVIVIVCLAVPYWAMNPLKACLPHTAQICRLPANRDAGDQS